MSSTSYAAPLSFRPEPSPRLGAMIILVHAGAVLWPMFLPLPRIIALIIAVTMSLSFMHTWRVYQGGKRITELLWREDGSWELTTAGSQATDARLAPQIYWSASVVVLRFQLEPRGTRTLVILPDSLDAEVFRRLRVRLRLEGGREAEQDALKDETQNRSASSA